MSEYWLGRRTSGLLVSLQLSFCQINIRPSGEVVAARRIARFANIASLDGRDEAHAEKGTSYRIRTGYVRLADQAQDRLGFIRFGTADALPRGIAAMA